MNFLVAQSGGPTSAINATLSGVIKACLEENSNHKIYGAINGIEGVLKDRFISLDSRFKTKETLEQLKHTPAMFLGSCRYKLSTDQNSEDYKRIFQILEKHKIDVFLYIGGNDSMDTVYKLSEYGNEIQSPIRFIGLPKTIDNDLVGTDHTPGFGSAAKYVSATLLDIAHDTYIYDQPSVTIVEIMGRNAGWLTAATALARNEYNISPDFIYLPEVPFDIFSFLSGIKEKMKTKKNIIIAVSEGIKDKDGRYIAACNSTPTDSFGHQKLSGTGKALEHLVLTALNCKVRSIELSVLQRSAMHIASKTDLDESEKLGQTGVKMALEGETGVMMALKRQEPYGTEVISIPVSEVANKEKVVPRHFISEDGSDVTTECIDYLLPLIQGESTLQYYNGLPCYLDITHLIA